MRGNRDDCDNAVRSNTAIRGCHSSIGKQENGVVDVRLEYRRLLLIYRAIGYLHLHFLLLYYPSRKYLPPTNNG